MATDISLTYHADLSGLVSITAEVSLLGDPAIHDATMKLASALKARGDLTAMLKRSGEPETIARCDLEAHWASLAEPMSRASEAARNLADAVQAAKDAAARSADALHYAATVTLAKAKAEGEMLTPATKRAAATIAAMAGVAPVSTLAAAVAAAKEAVMQSTAAVKRSKEAQDELIRTIEVFGSPVSDSERHARAALAEAGIANPSTALLRARLTLGHTKEARDLAHGWPGMLGVHGQTDLISALDCAETIAMAAYRHLLTKERLSA